MASITSLTGSNSTSSSSSIYGSRNVISGLASGLDTEALIENSVLGYKTKIQNLLKQQTKLSWKQDGYRKITDQLINLSQKYTSYTSKTNLSSPSFFANAVSTTTNGANKDKVAATGKSSSEIQLNAVKQVATAARYSVEAGENFNVNRGLAEGKAMQFNDDGTVTTSAISGSLTLKVDNKTVDLSFGKGEIYNSASELSDAINAKLKEQGFDNMITASESGGSISFNAGSAAPAGSSVWIYGASGSISSTLGIRAGTSVSQGDRGITVGDTSLVQKLDPAVVLKDESVSVTLDGKTKKIDLSGLASGEGTVRERLEKALKDGVKDAFGDKVGVSIDEETGKISFTTDQNSVLKVTSTAGDILGIGNGIGNTLDTSKKLGEIFENMDDFEALDETDENGNKLYALTINDKLIGKFSQTSALDSVISAINGSDAGVKVNYSSLTNKFTFSATETGSQGRIDFGEGLAKGLFGAQSSDTEYRIIGSDGRGVLADENGPIAAGVYKYTENGEEKEMEYYIQRNVSRLGVVSYSRVGLGENGLFAPLPGAGGTGRLENDDPVLVEVQKKARTGFTAGTDAVFNATINGENITLTRSSNVVEIDGLSVTLKDKFNEDSVSRSINGAYSFDKSKVEAGSAVTFTTKADADTIVDAVKSFVDELNQVLKDTREAYTTAAPKDSSGNRYEPLTDEDKASMTESQIKTYEEKAQTGLLYMDNDLSQLYNALRDTFSASAYGTAATGSTRKAMEAIGLTATYENGVTTLSLDEDKLRAALESDPDAVQKVFTDSTSNGVTTKGLMTRVKSVLDNYASTSVGSYGVLVRKAGTKLKSLTLLDNDIQNQMNSLDNQVDSWQSRMSDKIDYYTRQFTMLEKLMQEMNSQSSTLSGLMGY